MLNILRKQAQSTVIQILVLIIAIVFVFWGVGSNLGNKRNSLATVNGNEIPYEDYQRTYDTAIDNLRVQFGGNIPQGLLDSLGLKQQVLNQLVQAEILRQGGKDMGIHISQLATQDEIKKMEVFQQNGQFDLNRYKQILSQNRLTPVSFEAGLRNDLLSRRVTETIKQFAVLPESEVQSRFNFANEQIKLAYATFSSADFADQVVVDDEELAAWYDKQKSNYLNEPQIRLKYLFFSFDDDLGKVDIAEEQLKMRYEANKNKYTTPEQRHARHILFRINETDDEQVRTDKKAKAEEILRRAKEGADFAELARENSEGPTAPTGGDLGFFNKGAMVKQFDEAVFKMQPGSISEEVVETVFGYHIIKLEAVKPEVTSSFDEVKESIAADLQKENVEEITRKRAREAYEQIILSGSLDKYREKQNSDVSETDFFAKSSPPAGQLSDPAFLQTAFSLKKGELSSLVKTGNGYAILFVDDFKAPEVPELESIREKVAADFVNARSAELAMEQAQSVLELSAESKMLAADSLGGAELKKTEFIKRTNPADAGGLPVQVVQQGFELSSNVPLPQEPFRQNDVVYVFQLLEKRFGDEPLDDTQRQVLTEQLEQSLQGRLLSDWLAWMQNSADIWINDQILQ